MHGSAVFFIRWWFFPELGSFFRKFLIQLQTQLQTHLNSYKSDDRCESYSHFNKRKSVLILQNKMEQRANIKFCVILGKKFTKTYELMKKVYGDDCMSHTQVYTWFTRFKNGRDDLNDDPRPGRPEASNRAELVEKVREILAIDANFTVRMLAEELNLSYCTIYTILTEDLGKRKVCARFVPHQLNEDQKSQRIFNEKTDMCHGLPSVFG